jgi:SPP1 gp7 family putative phage head morphogenesis protein
MPFVNKARRIDPNLRKTNIGLTKREKEIYTIYSNAFKGVRNQLGDQKVLRDIMDALRANSASGVNNAINWRTFLESLTNTAPSLAAQMVEVANLHSKVLPKKIQYQYNFESKDPRAIAWAQTQAGKRIQGITLETQQAVADLIADGLRTKLSRDEIVAQLKQTVGLDKRQSKALGNFYMKRLEKYLEDGLTYEQAAAKAEKNGIRYRDKLLRQRAIRIARTEISSAANAGRYLSWEEANARGLLPPDSKKRWLTNIDERTCPICQPMNGTLIPWQATFSTGDIMPPAHPNCRCTSVIVPGEIQVIKSVEKHAPGRHDQKTHGSGGGIKAMTFTEAYKGFKTSEEESDALTAYSIDHYKGINLTLRNGVATMNNGQPAPDKNMYESTIAAIDRVIARAPQVERDKPIWRVMSPKAVLGLKEGETYVDRGFVSTTLNDLGNLNNDNSKDLMQNFLMVGGVSNVLAKILPNGNYKGLNMNRTLKRGYAVNLEEQEFLLPRNSAFTFLGFETLSNNQTIAVLERAN